MALLLPPMCCLDCMTTMEETGKKWTCPSCKKIWEYDSDTWGIVANATYYSILSDDDIKTIKQNDKFYKFLRGEVCEET